jgi:autotransporter-associated beta strand protein
VVSVTPVPDGVTEPVETIALTVQPAAGYLVAAGSATASTDLVDSLSLFDNQLAWYRFNETTGTIANDSANLNNDATLYNGPVWNSGALSFDGVNDYVQTPVANGGTRTLAAWINPVSSTTKACVFDTDVPYQYGTGWALVNGTIEVILDNQFWGTGVAVTNNTWQHVALAFDANQARLYLNGTLAATLNYGRGDITAANYKIGVSNANGGSNFNGQIRDARIFAIAVNDSEAAELPNGSLLPPTTAPTDLATAVSDGSVTLNWSANVVGATRYFISRATSPGGPFVYVGVSTGTSFTDTGLTNGTAYTYSVSAVTSNGITPASTSATATPTTDLAWNNSAGTGIWNAADANWSTKTWFAGATGVIAHTAAAQSISLQGGIQANLLSIGNATGNANYTLTGAAGASLVANQLRIQGDPGSHLGINPTTTLNDLALTVSGDLTVGRANAVIGGNSVVTANRIGGAIGGIANADWGQLTIQGNANVTATAGVVGNSTAWGLNLNGGTLTTTGIDYGPHAFNGTTNLNFNGTLVKASANNANFVTVTAGYDFVPVIQSGGARLDTNGYNIGIAAVLSGTGGLTKSGSGTLTLTAANTYTGATAVQAGTLVQQSSTAAAAHTIAAGAVLEFSTAATLNGPTTSFGGTGTLRKSGAGTTVWPSTAATFALGAGSLIDIQGGSFTAGSSANENWTANLSDLNVASGATFKTVEANVRVNRITGTGTIGTGYSGAGYQYLSIGVDNGSSEFAGSLTNTDNNASWPGSLVKLGTGTITLSGPCSHTGTTTVSAGKLVVSGTVSATSAVTVASGAQMEISGSLTSPGNLTNDGTLILTGAAQLNVAGTFTNNGTIINSAPGYTLPANLVNNGTVYTLPVAPAGLTATPGDAQVSLSWSAVSGATGYSVKQSVFSGGPYTTVATLSGTSQVITGLTNGSTYYFVVSASNQAGEGANSAQSTATPVSALPAPRVAGDIGNVGLAGSAAYASGTYTLQGAGVGLASTADACRFVYQPSSGDCDIIVRVQSLTNTGTNAVAGVMIRETLAANARCAGVVITPASGIRFTRRTTVGGSTSTTTSTKKVAPYWLRLTRTGTSFKAFLSTTGASWTQVGSTQTISMGTSAYIGILSASGNTTARSTAVITNESVTP